MSMSDFFSAVIGGGIISACITLWSNSSLSKTQRKLAYLQNQIDHFYGPMLSVIKYCQAFEQEIAERQTGLTDSMDTSALLTLIDKTNNRISKIILDNYAYIDNEDRELMDDYLIEQMKSNLENEYRYMGNSEVEIDRIENIFYLPEKFTENIKNKHKQKSNEIKALSCLFKLNPQN